MKRKVDFSLLPEGEFYLVLLRTGCVAVALKEYNSGDFWLLNSKQGKISKSKILYTSPFSEYFDEDSYDLQVKDGKIAMIFIKGKSGLEKFRKLARKSIQSRRIVTV